MPESHGAPQLGWEDVKGLALDKSVLFIGRPPACRD